MSNHDTLVYPAGTAILFTSGCYSDFRTVAALVTTRECDLKALAQEYVAAVGLDKWGGKPPVDGFGAWLIVNEHVFPAEISEVHLGDYDEFEPEFGVDYCALEVFGDE